METDNPRVQPPALSGGYFCYRALISREGRAVDRTARPEITMADNVERAPRYLRDQITLSLLRHRNLLALTISIIFPAPVFYPFFCPRRRRSSAAREGRSAKRSIYRSELSHQENSVLPSNLFHLSSIIPRRIPSNNK